MAEVFWWVVFPYVTLTIMVVGLLYRYAFRQLTWAAPSTNFLEKNGCELALLYFIMGLFLPLLAI